jgi:hypothetical protein
VETDGDEAGIAESVRGGTSAVAAAKVTGDALKTQNQDDIAVSAETPAITVVTSIAIMTSIAEAIAIGKIESANAGQITVTGTATL